MNNRQFLKDVGIKVRTARKARKITLENLARLCGTNITQLSFIENGKCNWHILTIKGIADVLKLDVVEFF